MNKPAVARIRRHFLQFIAARAIRRRATHKLMSLFYGAALRQGIYASGPRAELRCSRAVFFRLPSVAPRGALPPTRKNYLCDVAFYSDDIIIVNVIQQFVPLKNRVGAPCRKMSLPFPRSLPSMNVNPQLGTTVARLRRRRRARFKSASGTPRRIPKSAGMVA